MSGYCHPNMQILVVDDEKDMCWALQRIIEAEGHEVSVAYDAATALHLVQRQSFDLCLVDAKLPDMEGTELLDRLHCSHPALPCVLMSGYLCADDEVVQTRLRGGRVSTFIGKPFLLADVRNAVRSGRPVRELVPAL